VHPPSALRHRLLALSVLVALLLVALSSRLWYLQVLAGERYGDLAEGNRVRQVVVEAPRGRILDASGRVVVGNRAAWAVTVKPSLLGDRRREVLGRLAAGLAAVALVCAEILLQPDFGTFLVFMAILFGVLLVSGVQLRWLLVLALVGVLGTVGMFKLNVLREYQKERLTAFIDPGADDGGRGFTYNSRQALIAIGSGGVGGKGYLRGTQTNLQYVPEQKTDFIFTVIGEELGFAGAMALLALLGLLLWRGLRIAAVARDPFGALLAAGVVAMLAFQAFVNIGMTVGIMPITGIPLPFVSYGGSSLVATFLAVGLLENVHMRRYL
jgi:rod shape determining protein RodA